MTWELLVLGVAVLWLVAMVGVGIGRWLKARKTRVRRRRRRRQHARCETCGRRLKQHRRYCSEECAEAAVRRQQLS